MAHREVVGDGVPDQDAALDERSNLRLHLHVPHCVRTEEVSKWNSAGDHATLVLEVGGTQHLGSLAANVSSYTMTRPNRAPGPSTSRSGGVAALCSSPTLTHLRQRRSIGQVARADAGEARAEVCDALHLRHHAVQQHRARAVHDAHPAAAGPKWERPHHMHWS